MVRTRFDRYGATSIKRRRVSYIVDCNDQDRLDSAREELHKMLLEEEVRETSLLVLAKSGTSLIP